MSIRLNRSLVIVGFIAIVFCLFAAYAESAGDAQDSTQKKGSKQHTPSNRKKSQPPPKRVPTTPLPVQGSHRGNPQWERITNVPLTVRLHAVRSTDLQRRADSAIQNVPGISAVRRSGPADEPVYQMIAADLDAVQRLNGVIRFVEMRCDSCDQYEASFSLDNLTADYTTTNLNAQLKVVLNFQVTPGSTLLYKFGGRNDDVHEITHLVQPDGNVTLDLTSGLRPGDDYIFAKAIHNGVIRYLRVNIYTARVEEICEDDYRKEIGAYRLGGRG